MHYSYCMEFWPCISQFGSCGPSILMQQLINFSQNYSKWVEKNMNKIASQYKHHQFYICQKSCDT